MQVYCRGIDTAAVGVCSSSFWLCVVASCWDAGDGVGGGETEGVAVVLTAAVVAGVCCCEKPKPNINSGRASKPKARVSPSESWLGLWWYWLQVKNCPSVGLGGCGMALAP
jgi:hypothetical protein